MIVPKFWSESKTKKVVNEKHFTLKRFGWSDISEQDAKQMADSRLQEAEKTLELNGTVRRVDHKTSYNGAEGIPIREEVIDTYEDVVISRNAYGAQCLNTPDVLFADIDLDYSVSKKMYLIIFLVSLFGSTLVSLYVQTMSVFYINILLSIFFTSIFANFINNIMIKLTGGAEKKSLNIIKQVSIQNPELNIRIYRTPLGFRTLFMNDTYSSENDSTIDLLHSLKSDPIYIQMCKNQSCFRARLTPKPWRIGVSRIKPTPGIWPIKQKYMAARIEWVKKYELESQSYSACHFISQIGSNKVNKKAEMVRVIHDEKCNVNNKSLKLA